MDRSTHYTVRPGGADPTPDPKQVDLVFLWVNGSDPHHIGAMARAREVRPPCHAPWHAPYYAPYYAPYDAPYDAPCNAPCNALCNAPWNAAWNALAYAYALCAAHHLVARAAHHLVAHAGIAARPTLEYAEYSSGM